MFVARLFGALSIRTFTTAKVSKKEEVSAYLQVIHPREIHQMVEQAEHTTASLIKELKYLVNTNGDSSQLQQLQSQIHKSIKYLKPNHMKDIIKLKSEKPHPIVTHLYKSIVNHLVRNLDTLPIQTLIDMTYQMAKCNLKEEYLMKQLQARILDDGVPLIYNMIRKLLFVYTHLDVGSATIYSKITRTIRLGYHQLQPHHLAEFAYHLSKVSENAKGGYGVFKIAEQTIVKNIYRLSFSQLVTISGFMLTQNLGSNAFQLGMEEQLCKKFPVSTQLNMNHLKQLIHSTSGYHFKYKDNTLGQLLENQTIRNIKYATLEQADIILWSWGRAKRGNKDLWEALQNFYLQKCELLNVRQLAFDYYSFTKSPQSCSDILDKLQKAFGKLELQSINKHYLLKFIQGMQQRRAYNAPLFLRITEVLVCQMVDLSSQQFINFLKVLNESDFDFESTDIDPLKQLLKSFEHKLITKLSTLKVSDTSQILYLWTKLNLSDSQEFVTKLIGTLEDVNSIPKHCFLKALFSLVIKDQYTLSYEMIQILFQLREYGPIGYFFSPFEYPLLAYSVFTYYVKGRTPEGERLLMDQEFMSEIKYYFYELEPKSLNGFMEKIYNQTQLLIHEHDTIGTKAGNDQMEL